MNYYELFYIIPAHEQIEGIREEVNALVLANNGEILRHEEAGRIRLAYQIGKTQQGVYMVLFFRAEPKSIPALKNTLQLLRTLSRFELVKTTESRVKKPIQLMAYQEPMVERDRDERRNFVRPSAPRPRAPVAAPATPISSEELEKQIDKIIEEKVL